MTIPNGGGDKESSDTKSTATTFNPGKMGSPLPGKQAGLPVGAVIAEAVRVTGW